jgi:hypothetical protein
MTKRASPASVIAATFSMDSRELAEYRYQATRTAQAVYAVSDRYFTTGATEPKGLLGRSWARHPDQFFAQQAGTVLWVADAGEA